MSELITVEQHLAEILAAVSPLAGETVELDDVRGRTTHETVYAAVGIPVFDNSAMDGFAVRFAEVADASARYPVTLTVVADLPAGSPDDPRMPPRSAVRIMTGSPVPTDADAIVPFEDTAGGLAGSLDEVIVVAPPRATGAHIRRAAEDIPRGGEVVAAGIALGPRQLGAAAAAGVREVQVTRTPRVAVVSTGSELVEPGSPLQRGQIPESNARLLDGLVREAGARVVRRETIPDEPAALERLLDDLDGGADVVVFSGGVSAGAYEVVKQSLTGRMSFRKVAMQPGKPQGFGMLADGAIVFGLPGNPVSVAVSFEVFVRPALLALQGRRDLHRPTLALPVARGWRTPPSRRQYLPVTVDRTDPRAWTVSPATTGGSHLAGGLARAEGYAIVPAEVDAVEVGDVVEVMLLP